MAGFDPLREDTTLKQVVERAGPLDFKRAARYIEEVARQLTVCHDRGRTHGDVRPGNILLDEMGSARLGSPPDWRQDREVRMAIEDEDLIIEMVDYLAPERALNSAAADGRADIYSLGCTFYFLLTGRPPFASGSISQRLRQHQTGMPTDITSLRPDIPPSLARICSTMLAKKPADRFATAMQVAESIATWRKGAN